MSEEEETPRNLGSFPDKKMSEKLHQSRHRERQRPRDASSISRRSSYHHGASRTDSSAASESKAERGNSGKQTRGFPQRHEARRSMRTDDEIQPSHPQNETDMSRTNGARLFNRRAPRHPQVEDSGIEDKMSALPRVHQSYHSGATLTGSRPLFPESRSNRQKNRLEERSMQMAYSANEERIKELERIVQDLSRELNEDGAGGRATRNRSSSGRPPSGDRAYRDTKQDRHAPSKPKS